nr:hypothetical protein BJQ95_02101 [Cryobacterium sp. SO1]
MKVALWTMISITAVASANIIDDNLSSTIATLPLLLLGVAAVLHNRQLSLTSALVVSLGLLLISRSVLAPNLLSTTAPIWVSGLLFLALLLNVRELRLPKSSILVALLSLMLVLPTVVQSDLNTTAKSFGIGAMWVLVFLSAANIKRDQRRRVAVAFVVAACAEAVLAILESLVKVEFVRELITGSAAEQRYILRDNLILGDWTNRAQGTLGYPIPFAAFLVVGLFVALLSGVIRGRLWVLSVVVLLTTGIILSGTRSAAAALAVGLATWCVSLVVSAHLHKKKLPGVRLAVVATLIVGAAGVAFLIRSVLIGDFSLLHRGAVIDTAWGLRDLPLLRLLFGSGYNSAPILFDEGILSTGGLETIDNALITQMIVSGLVGLLLLVSILVLAVKRADLATRSVLTALVAFYFFFDVMAWHAMTGILLGAVGFAATTKPDVPLDPAALESGQHGASPLGANPAVALSD